MDLTPFTKAGLRVHEISALAGVSRVSAGNWMRGVTTPHVLIREDVEELLEKVSGAVDAGELPLHHLTKREDRLNKIREVLSKR